jgi:hypothetical protein
MSNSFIQVPPNSTGSKVATSSRTELAYDNKTDDLPTGATVAGSISSASGIITANSVTDGTSGVLYLKDVSGTFVNDENLQISAVTRAVSNITGTTPLQTRETQSVLISDPENPEYVQRIDRFGATINTFTDGAPTFSPFGAMAMGERQPIKTYKFTYDGMDELFYDLTQGSGTITWEPVAGTMLFSAGASSGDLTRRTSHFYHPYVPGIGTLIMMTCRSGDTGKANVRRRWGYFDDYDGVFFQLDGTQFSVVVRSSVTGSVIDTVTNQADFSIDSLDGNDTINFTLDPSKPNIYWIDLQWLGTGRVRFGVFEPEGQSLVAHIETHANVANTFPYMRTATLPLRVEQENTGTAGSGSEFRFNCATVDHSSKVPIFGAKHTEYVGTTQINDSDGEVYLFGIRSKFKYNGRRNKGIIKFKSFSVFNTPSLGNAPVIYRVYSSLDSASGSVWNSHASNSLAEFDSSGTTLPIGHETLSAICAPNQTLYEQNNQDPTVHDLELYNYADSSSQPIFYVTAEMLAGGKGFTEVGGAINWEELKN